MNAIVGNAVMENAFFHDLGVIRKQNGALERLSEPRLQNCRSNRTFLERQE